MSVSPHLGQGLGGEEVEGALEPAADLGRVHLGGAWAYHQYHPSPDPPGQHLTDIVRNAAIFHRRWGWWPMTGWRREFERRGLIVFEVRTHTWRIV